MDLALRNPLSPQLPCSGPDQSYGLLEPDGIHVPDAARIGGDVGSSIQPFRTSGPQSEPSTLWLQFGNSTTQLLDRFSAASLISVRDEYGSNLPCNNNVGMSETTGSWGSASALPVSHRMQPGKYGLSP